MKEGYLKLHPKAPVDSRSITHTLRIQEEMKRNEERGKEKKT
jgi:hypothetical protein